MHGDTFILNCIDTVKLFNGYISSQCKLNVNNSVLPNFEFLTDKIIDTFSVTDSDILALIRKLNPNKAAGSDGISSQMLLICDTSIVKPLKILFLNTG